MSNENESGKLTTGNWSIEMVRHAPIQKEFGCYLLLDGKRNSVALISSWMDSPDTAEEAEANARLICSAPDLLEALELLTVAAEYGGYPGSDAIRKANEAIARARGLSQ